MRALPVLLAEPIGFKVASSLSSLAKLNAGRGTLSQVGKFITIYPVNDTQAVRVAVELAKATDGLRGPRILSDHPLHPGSVVYYRYGSFGGQILQNRNGELAFALRTPDGSLVPDLRGLKYEPPAWARDPFLAAGVASELEALPPLVGGRFLKIGTTYRSARGALHLAIDLDEPRVCILKHAHAGSLMSADGRDARDHLRHEADIIERLGSDPRFPTFIALVEQNDDLYLAMDEIVGETLESQVLAYNASGCTLSEAQVVAWGRELADMLSAVHAIGFVYRDLKSTNVMVTSDKHLCLVDFGQACELGSSGVAPGQGTRGYMSPQQVAGEPANFIDDIYSLGALLAYMITGAEPSQAPRPLALLDRPLELLNPAISRPMADVIGRCLAADTVARFSDVTDVKTALAAIPSTIAAMSYCGRGPSEAAYNEAAARRRCRDLSRRLGNTICHVAEPIRDGEGLAWASDHPLGLGLHGRDVNTGCAGTLLALAEIVSEFNYPLHREVLSRGALGLANMPRHGGEPLPGLYVGEAGVAASLLRAGQVLGDGALIEIAAERGRQIAAMAHTSPDLFNGSAGRLRFHLYLWDETHAAESLGHAVAAAEHIIETMEDAGGGRRRWRIPPGFGGLGDQCYLGYAHGAAGIADSLLDLLEITGDVALLEAAQGAARWLADLARPALDQDRGLSWPPTEDAQTAPAYWCHGSAGIGQFFVHAAAMDILPAAADLAAGAVASTAQGVRWAGPTQCHGLTGAVELLIDAYQMSRDPERLAEARVLDELLGAFAVEDGQILVWPSESPSIVSPDYNVGYAGVAVALLRLADPERRPRGLSRRAFRFAGTRHEDESG